MSRHTRGQSLWAVWFVAGVVALLPVLAVRPLSTGATIVVNSTTDVAADDGLCTLREAITAANQDASSGSLEGECTAGSGDDAIDLTDVRGTIELELVLPDIAGDLTLSGPGAAELVVRRADSAGEFRILLVNSGTSVTVTGLTISHGRLAEEWGGGILNVGRLTLSECVVSHSSADDGGGVFNMGSLTLENSSIHNCQATRGGGLFNYFGGASMVRIVDSSIRDNQAVHGGGIYNAGRLEMDGCTVEGNEAARGGGLANDQALADVTDCSIRTNLSRFAGGGISNSGSVRDMAVLTLTNSTVSGNEAAAGDGGGIYAWYPTPTPGAAQSVAVGEGGGVYTGSKVTAEPRSALRLINSSVSGNSAMRGGGIACTDFTSVELGYSTVSGNEAIEVGELGGTGGGFHSAEGVVTSKGSLIAGNSASVAGADCYGAEGLSSEGFNLIGETSGCDWPFHPNDLVDVVPLLGPLQDNGGATETHALLAGSLARDAIPAASCTDLSGVPIIEDQRGVSRPQGPWCDIGSFEALAVDADLSLITRASPVLAFEGDPVVFAVQIVNQGPLDATGVAVRDDLAAGLYLVSFAVSQGGYVAETGLWSAGSVPVGSMATLTLTTRVEAGTVGAALSNSASIVAADQPDPVPENNASVVSVTIADLLAVYLPGVFSEYIAFPIHVGDAIPSRLAYYHGEVFYTTMVRLPDELPQGGTFYFSARPQAVAESLVDDELVVRLDGQPVFAFDFSMSGSPIPARVQVSRTTMAQLAGKAIEVIYRDRYAARISASEMWLIWVP